MASSNSSKEAALDGESRHSRARFLSHSPTPVPRFLYKFVGGASPGLRGMLVDSALWLSSPLAFNDPFDARAHITLAIQPLAMRRQFLMDDLRQQGIAKSKREGLVSAMLAGDALQNSLQETYEKEIAALGVCCFTGKSARNILMWSHYAAQHAGACLQFHTVGAPAILWRLRPTQYRSELLHIDWINREQRKNGYFEALHRKAEMWSYEREHRIVMTEHANTPIRFNPRALTGVVLGCNTDSSFEAHVVELCRERQEQGHPPVRLFKAKRHPRSYALTIERWQPS